MSADETLRALLVHAPSVRRHINNRIPHPLRRDLDADDVLQEVWTRVMHAQRHTSISEIAHVEQYLKCITSSVLVDRLRAAQAIKRGGHRDQAKTRSANELRSSYADLLEQVTGPQKTPSSEVAVLEAVDAIHGALARIPETQREAVRLRHILGLSNEEVGQRMNRSQSAIYGLLTRGMLSLRAELGFAGRFLSDAASDVD